MEDSRAPRIRGAVSYAARLADQPRLLLAVKTAIAAVLAWYLAPLIPFAEDQYSYYAPLGALVTMHPTVARSASVGVQVLMGLALGIAVSLGGVAAMRAGVPGGVVLAVVLGVAVLLGGLRFLGAGGNWVALASLFVLLAAGGDPEEFSVSYLGTVAFGVVVGIVVNLVLLPPVYLRRAGERLSTLRDTLADVLRDAAEALERGELDRDELSGALERIADTRSSVTADVSEADESVRANPRRRRHVNKRNENAERMTALERTAFLTRELVDLLLELEASEDSTLTDATRGDLVRTVVRVADLVSTPLGDSRGAERLNAATRALEAYEDRLVAPDTGLRRQTAAAAAVDLCLRRIIDASRPFV